MTTKSIKKLAVKTLDYEPGETDPVEVTLGDKKYVAYCPNDFEFASIAKQATLIERDPLNFDFEKFIEAFFTPVESYDIARRLKGKPPEIGLFSELAPTLFALIEHYQNDVENRMKIVQDAVAAQKKESARQQDGQTN